MLLNSETRFTIEFALILLAALLWAVASVLLFLTGDEISLTNMIFFFLSLIVAPIVLAKIWEKWGVMDL